MINVFRKMMKEQYGIHTLNGSENFKRDFGLTSFDFVNLICLIEERFDIEIDEKDYRSLNTIDELIQYIEAKKSCEA